MSSQTARTENAPELSTQLRTHLKAYSAFVLTVDSALKDVNQIQSELDTDGKPLPLVRPRLERQLEVVGEHASEEMKRIDQALETIDLLLAAQQQQQQSIPSVQSAEVSSDPSSVESLKRGPYKKRRLDATISIPPAPVMGAFPSSTPNSATPLTASSKSTPGGDFGTQLQQQQALHQQMLASNLLQQQQKPNAINNKPITTTNHATSSAQPSPVASAASSSQSHLPTGMGLSAMPGATSNQSAASTSSASTSAPVAKSSTPAGGRKQKNRRDALANQLPLKTGRSVAFRQPKKGNEVSGGVTMAGGKEDWILARIENCIGGDKNKYTVFDVDYDPENPTPDGGRFSTTLKSIIPLPDPRDRARTYPESDYAKGTQVMALYPDTTSFYSARIVGGPIVEKGKQKKEKIYHVVFDEDGGKIEPVPVELVVEIPN